MTRRLVAALVAAAALPLAACQAGAGQVSALADGPHPASTLPLGVTISPADGTRDVLPTDRVTVTATHGHLRDVAVVGRGTVPALRGTLHGDTWRSDPGQQLPLDATYSVSADVVDGDRAEPVTSSFHVVDRAHALRPAVAPFPGETVGVGMPVMVFFGARVHDKAAVERLMTVTSSGGGVGAWHWFGDREAHYRPRSYWRAGSVVTVDLHLLGARAGAGVRGISDRHFSFRVGPAHVSRVDALAHRMVVTSDGRVVRTMLVSTGRDKYPSMSGVHLVVEKTKLEVMDSQTVGIPRKSKDGYFEKVPWSTRISYSGEFVHAASWSVHDQGRRNVSHGCVNVSPQDGEWFYYFSRRGDVVVISGTKKHYPQGSGFQDWTYSWAEWLRGSALAH